MLFRSGTGGDFVRSIGVSSSMAVPSFAAFRIHRRRGGCRLCCGALDGIRLRRRFSRRRSSGGRACARFPFGALLPAVWRAEAPSDGFAILLQAHGRLRSSRFIVRRRTCRRKPFFEADGRRRTCLGAGRRPDRSGGGVRYAVVPEPLRVLSVAYATACGGTGRRDFLFGAIWGRRLVPRLARSGRLRAGMTDGPVRNEDRLLATRQRRAEAAMRWPRSLRRPFGVLRPSCGDRPDSCHPALFLRSGAAVPQKVLPQICRGDGASKGTGRTGRRGSEFLERNNKKPVFYVIFAQRGFLSRTSACRGRACSGT